MRRSWMLVFALFWPVRAAYADEAPSESFVDLTPIPRAVVYGGLCLLVALGAGLALRRRRGESQG